MLSMFWGMQGKFGFKWTTTFEILGIHYDITKMGEITDLNIYRKMGEIRTLIRVWGSRNLTPYGKVSIIKSLLMSKITHVLLSLPSPSVICMKELYNTFSSFLWSGKPPKWRKEILESEIHHGGLKLHNISLFDQTLKLSWLRRYLSSRGKWTIIPFNIELSDAFKYGPIYLERIIETTSNKFWVDVIKSTQMLWQSNAIFDREVICNTPLWLHDSFKLPIKREWIEKGINSIADFLSPTKTTLTMEELTEYHGVKTNFLEYHGICLKIKKFLEFKDVPLRFKTLPRNSTLNMLVNLNTKGCSRLYSKVKNSDTHILDTLVEKWAENSDVVTDAISVSRSFHKHHLNYKDTYLKYLQFRSLHHRFYTNEKLYNMGLVQSNLCSMCKTEVDSIEHMFLGCPHVIELWENVTDWIVELGMPNYVMTASRMIIGDLENALAINTIILHTKKVIYNAKKKEQIPHILNVKHEVQNFYYQEKYRQYIKGRNNIFDKQYNLLTVFYNT